jgi:hypothetical protein
MMTDNPEKITDSYISDVTITTVLRIEHRMLREMMEAMAEWLAQAPASAAVEMRERVSLLAVALEAHALREEAQLLALLRPISEQARHLVDLMEIVHDEIRGLFEEIATEPAPKDAIWTILDLAETHFVREDEELFPLAEQLLPRARLVELASQE